jgi:cyclohexanone monooxygenase
VTKPIRVAILGAGLGGLALAHRLTLSGFEDFTIFERDDGVGGTWRANTYPGAACDVPSHLYSLSFAPNPNWSRTYATQPEILAYIEATYDSFGFRSKLRLNTEIVTAVWSSSDSLWRLGDRDGIEYEAEIVVSATGIFHTPSTPSLPGLETFAGRKIHSARWDHTIDLRNRRVAVIGTGASAIQVVPAVAPVVDQLDLYQRSAPWILPRKDDLYTSEQRVLFATQPDIAIRHRQELYDLLEQTSIFRVDDIQAEELADISRDYLTRKVADPILRAALTPDVPFGCKRTLISSEYYPSLQQPNVDLITRPIKALTKRGIRSEDGTERETDVIVWCTGFRAGEYLHGLTIIGYNGINLHDVWAGSPRGYHGLAVPGFPNFFMLYGPNTNQGGNSIILILEAQSHFVASALELMRDSQVTEMEVTSAAMEEYSDALARDLKRTIWASPGCRTYFHNAAGDIVTQLPHTSGWYRRTTENVEVNHFTLRGPTASLIP